MDLTRVTQMAWGRLEPGEIISKHNHPDMDECFFVTKGVGMITVDDEDFELSEGVFLIVPAMAWHSLTCVGEVLEFFYFGLQIYRKELV